MFWQLARIEELLYVVACVLNPAKSEDFGKLRYAQNILAREVFADSCVRIIPVVFTSATGCPSYDNSDDMTDPIPIIDFDQFEFLLYSLRGRREDQFFQFVENPVLPYRADSHFLPGNLGC